MTPQEYPQHWKLASFKEALSAGQNACKAGLTLNGAAALAILAFIGSVVTKVAQPISMSSLAAPLLVFGMGAFFGGGGSGFTYLAQANFTHTDNFEAQAKGKNWNRLAVASVILSFVLFPLGLLSAYFAFAKGFK